MKKMKSLVSFALVFLLLSSLAVIYADSKSLVGRKVQADAVVTLNGQVLGSALIIDGVSYAPVRVIAEASGLEAGYKKGEVILSSVEGTGTNELATQKSVEEIDVDALSKEKRRLQIQVDTLNNYIKDLNYSISQYAEMIEKIDDETVNSFKTMKSEAEANLLNYQTELTQAEQRIAEIDNLLK